MFGRKKTPAPVVAEESPKPLPDHEVELCAEWDDEDAEYEYVLYRIEPTYTFIGRPNKPEPGNWHWHRQAASFEKDWADRQAEHYKVEITYVEAK